MIKRLRPFLILCVLAFPAIACSAEVPPRLQTAAEVLKRLSKSGVRAYSTRDFGREKYEGAISALVPEPGAEALLEELRRQLPSGLVAFIGTTRSLAEPPAAGVEIVIGSGTYPLDILEIAQSDAANYDMVTKDLKARLGKWHSAYGIDVWQAETDTIQLRLKSMPKDLKAFAREVYKFCPDVVDQGLGSVSALEQAIKREQGVTLWWD